ncbi:MAG: hypothetical protein ACREFZ_03790 [Acetobacteraceae bacterium]
MATVKRSRNDLDAARFRAALRARRVLTETVIARHTAEDKDAWTASDLAAAATVYPPPTPEQVKALRASNWVCHRGSLASCFG